jgi:hypothetical protein
VVQKSCPIHDVEEIAMSRTTLKLAGILSVMILTPAVSRANDIEDFFKSLRGDSHDHGRHQSSAMIQPVGHHHDGRSGHRQMPGPAGHHGGFGMSSRDAWKVQQQFAGRHHGDHYGDRGNAYDLRDHSSRHSGYRGHSGFQGGRGSGWTFRVSGGTPPIYAQPVLPQYPVIPQYPVAPQVPVIPQMPVMSHQLGQIVDCPVPLATCVRIEDACNIAPNAVPVTVAVRNPDLPPYHEGCVDSLIYVEVCVPPCPMQQLVISPCRTRIKMDFGSHQVELKSRNGMVIIDYDN